MKTTRLIIGMLATLGLASLYDAVFAEGFPEKTGYLIDSRGNVVRNAYGECWRTGYWTPAMAIAECDPQLVLKAETIIKETPTSAGPIAPVPPPSAPMSPPAAEKTVVAAPALEKPAVAASFNAETLFDFDKAVVKPEGRKMLDEKIVARMKMHPEVSLLLITGHADFIGTDAYNQKLSERRANAVKAYLVTQGIAAERMRASGKGESEPNPEANTGQACKGKRGDRLIACLQPDRRVTVESQRRAPAR